jgi:hypothetical protein
MTRAPGLRAARVVLALALLGSPAVAATSRPLSHPPRAAVSASIARRAWAALVNFASRLGSGLDPDGAQASPPSGAPGSPAAQPATPTSDLGSIMDPNG